MPPEPLNRRSEPRVKMAGEIVLSFADPVPCEIQAQLMDVSPSGFRAAYDSPALSPGQLVGFQRVAAQGNARVIWTRISGAQIQSGFVLV